MKILIALAIALTSAAPYAALATSPPPVDRQPPQPKDRNVDVDQPEVPINDIGDRFRADSQRRNRHHRRERQPAR